MAFRFIAANDHPDHDTIATFRRRFLAEIEGLFVQVLLLARGAGVLKLGAHSACKGINGVFQDISFCRETVGSLRSTTNCCGRSGRQRPTRTGKADFNPPRWSRCTPWARRLSQATVRDSPKVIDTTASAYVRE